MEHWSNSDLEYYRAMPANERSHPLLRALHTFQPDIVAFFVSIGLSPGQQGTVHPYSGDNLASEDGFTHDVSSRQLWSLLWQANIIDGASARQPRLLREMHALLGVGPEAGADDTACRSAASTHMARLWSLYESPPADASEERRLRASHYHRFFFERGPLPTEGRGGTRYSVSDAVFAASVPDASIAGAEHTPAALLQQQRRLHVAALAVPSTSPVSPHAEGAVRRESVDRDAIAAPVRDPALNEVAPRVFPLPVLAMLRTDVAAFSLATVPGAVEGGDAVQDAPLSPTFDDDPMATFPVNVADCLSAMDALQAGRGVAASAAIQASAGARKHSSRKAHAPKRLDALRSPGGGWPAALSGAVRAAAGGAKLAGAKRRAEEALPQRPGRSRPHPRVNKRRQRRVDAGGVSPSERGSRGGDSAGEDDDRSRYARRQSESVISLSSDSSSDSDSSSGNGNVSGNRRSRASGIAFRDSRVERRSGAPKRVKDSHPRYAFDINDPAFDESCSGSETTSTTDRSCGSRAAFESHVPVRLRGGLFVVKGADSEGGPVQFREDVSRAVPAPPTVLGRAWFEEGLPASFRGDDDERAGSQHTTHGVAGKLAAATASKSQGALRSAGDRARNELRPQSLLTAAWDGAHRSRVAGGSRRERTGGSPHAKAAATKEPRRDRDPAVRLDSDGGGYAESPPREQAPGSGHGLTRSPPTRVAALARDRPAGALVHGQQQESIYDSAGRRRGTPDDSHRRGGVVVHADHSALLGGAAPAGPKAVRSLKREIVQAGFFSFQRAQMKALQLRVDAMSRWIQLCAGDCASSAVSGWAQQQARAQRHAFAGSSSTSHVTPLARLMQLAPPVKRSALLVAAANVAFPEAARAPQPVTDGRRKVSIVNLGVLDEAAIPSHSTPPLDTAGAVDEVAGGIGVAAAAAAGDENPVDWGEGEGEGEPVVEEPRRLLLRIPPALVSGFPLQAVRVDAPAGLFAMAASPSQRPRALREPWDAVVPGLCVELSSPVADSSADAKAPLLFCEDSANVRATPEADDSGLDVNAYLLRLELADAPEEAVRHLLLSIAPLTLSDLESEEMRCVAGNEGGVRVTDCGLSCQSCADGNAVLRLLVQLLQQTTAFVRRRAQIIRQHPAIGADDEAARRVAFRLIEVLFTAANELMSELPTAAPGGGGPRLARPLLFPVTFASDECGRSALLLRAYATIHAFVAAWCCEFSDLLRSSADGAPALALAGQCAELMFSQTVQALVDFPAIFEPRDSHDGGAVGLDEPAAWMLIAMVTTRGVLPSRSLPTSELMIEATQHGLVASLWESLAHFERLPSWTLTFAVAPIKSALPLLSDVGRVEVVWALLTAAASVSTHCVPELSRWGPLARSFLQAMAAPELGAGLAALTHCSVLRLAARASDEEFHRAVPECTHELAAATLVRRRAWHTDASVSGVRCVLLRRSEGFFVHVDVAAVAEPDRHSPPTSADVVQTALNWSSFQLRRLHEQLSPLCALVALDRPPRPIFIDAWIRALLVSYSAIVSALKPPTNAFRLPVDCMRVDLSTYPTRPRVVGASPCAAVVGGLRPVETTPLVRGWLSHSTPGTAGDATAQLISGVDASQLGLFPDWLIAAACAGRLQVAHWRLGAQTYVEWIREAAEQGVPSAASLEKLTKRAHRALQAIVGGWLFAAAGGGSQPIPVSGGNVALDSEPVNAASCLTVAQCLRSFVPRTQPGIVRFYASPPAQPPPSAARSAATESSGRTLLQRRPAPLASAHVPGEPPRFTYLNVEADRSIGSRLCSHPELQANATVAVLEMLTSTRANRAQRVLHAVNMLADVQVCLARWPWIQYRRFCAHTPSLTLAQHSDAAARAVNVQASWAVAALILRVSSGFASIVKDTVDALAGVVAATLWDMDARALAHKTMQEQPLPPRPATGKPATGKHVPPPARVPGAKSGPDPSRGLNTAPLEPCSSALNASADVWVMADPALARWGSRLLEQDLAVLQLVADALLVLSDLQSSCSPRPTQPSTSAPPAVAVVEFARLLWRPVECSFRRVTEAGESVDCTRHVSLATLLRCAVDTLIVKGDDSPAMSRARALAAHTCRSVFTLVESALVGERTPLLRVVYRAVALARPVSADSMIGASELSDDAELAAFEEMGLISEAASQGVRSVRCCLEDLSGHQQGLLAPAQPGAGSGQLLVTMFPVLASLERFLLEQVCQWLKASRPVDADADVGVVDLPRLPRDDISALSAAVYGPLSPVSVVAVMRRNFVDVAPTATVPTSVATAIRLLVSIWWLTQLNDIASPAGIVAASAKAAGAAAAAPVGRPAAAGVRPSVVHQDDRPILVRFVQQYGPEVDSAGSFSWARSIWSTRGMSPQGLSCVRHFVWPVMLAALLDRMSTFPGFGAGGAGILAARSLAVAGAEAVDDPAVTFDSQAARLSAIRVLRNAALQPALAPVRAALVAVVQRAAVHAGGSIQRSLIRAWLATSLWAGGSSSEPGLLGAFISLTRGISWFAEAGLPPDTLGGFYAQLMTLSRVWLPLVEKWRAIYRDDEDEGDAGDAEDARLEGSEISAAGARRNLAACSTSLPDKCRLQFWAQLEVYRQRAPLQSEILLTLRDISAGLPPVFVQLPVPQGSGSA